MALLFTLGRHETNDIGTNNTRFGSECNCITF
jgi:hypothetical protein